MVDEESVDNDISVSSIKSLKSRIKNKLNSIEDSDGPGARLSFALAGVENASKQGGEKNAECFIYAMSALVQNERSGGLSRAQVEDLFGVLDNLIRVLKQRSLEPVFRYLCADLYSLKSQYNRKQGDLWGSAWDLQLAEHFDYLPQSGRGLLGLALINFRMGNGPSAELLFKKVEDLQARTTEIVKARLNRAILYRLTHRYEQCDKLLSEISDMDHAYPGLEMEIEWQKKLVNASIEGDYSDIVKAVSRQGTHYVAPFFVEGYLWVLCSSRKSWYRKLSKISAVGRSRSLHARTEGFFFDAAETLDRCFFQDETSIDNKLLRLRPIILNLNSLPTIDKVLLVLMTIGKWLQLSQLDSLHEMIRTEYTAISRQLSDGLVDDALGWFSPTARHRPIQK